MSKPDYSGTYHMVEQTNMDAYLEGLGEAGVFEPFSKSAVVPENAIHPPGRHFFCWAKAFNGSSVDLVSVCRCFPAAGDFSAMKSSPCPSYDPNPPLDQPRSSCVDPSSQILAFP